MDDPRPAVNILLIDNHDSFTGILAHLLFEATGQLPEVITHDDPGLTRELIAARDAVVISPGPGNPHHPADLAGSTLALEQFDVPVLGVCLGMQAIAVAAGARVGRARHPMHGSTSTIDGFAGLAGPLTVTRYHSLAVDEASLPATVEVTSRADDGTIMALRRTDAAHYGVQFHPESVGTDEGVVILRAMLVELGLVLPKRVTWYSEQLHDAPGLPAIAVALGHLADSVVWLDSSDDTHPTGVRSILAADLGNGYAGATSLTALAEHAAMIPAVQITGGGEFRPGIFTALTYEQDQALVLSPDVVVVADPAGTWVYLKEGTELPDLISGPARPAPAPSLVDAPRADHSREQYLAAVRACQEHIRAGDSYELCLTTTVRAELTRAPDPLALYLRLREQARAPMASFWRVGDTVLLSASPERFLRVDEHHLVHASPIKGTIARGNTSESDRENIAQLANSVKDRAENQMIVDLMRHDIAAWCQPGSVSVPELCQVHTFTTGHQMISTVSGRLRQEVSAHEVVAAAFPPGSMTGAPKQRTMELLRTLEPQPRGWYSGVAGHLGADGTADFAVLIRTAVLAGNQLTYGAGGAVTALSDPAAEAAEVHLKLLPLRRLLGIPDHDTDWLEEWT